MENLIRQGTVQGPIFTVALTDSHKGLSVANAGVIAQQVFSWGEQNAARGAVGQAGSSARNQASSQAGELGGSLATTAAQPRPNHPAIIDTSTTLMLLDDMTLLTIYNSIPGARLDNTIGDQFYGVPGSTMAFAKLDGGRCYGAMQSRGDFPTDIMGDAFIKNQMVVFDQNPTAPRLGFAYRPDVVFQGQPGL
ncbi:aspartic peptidase domain-containing protein [Protomyces lactucae-debilis]|uniref:Aspartic peptidase domain-containing protein n=1 Tax=Protomyces lactucae-debilis TaxID=2754530 RepID=A0A1Y2FBR2_PROLT|nr:aspartic peptidase domain-containing protein [Protomyces lactucae-debilis]ORY81359.1 aspartic peptidase domain-containing protein [Protomyces lactucae-debilis]